VRCTGMSSQDKAKKLGIIWGTLPSSEKEKWAPSPSAASSSGASGVLQCVAVCCSVLQRVCLCYSVCVRVAVVCSVLQW